MTEKSRKTHKQNKNASKNSTCTNDVKISLRIREQNFTSYSNCTKMVEYYVNAPKMEEKSTKTHKQ